MKRTLVGGLFAAAALLGGLALTSTVASAATPVSYEQDWNEEMNQETYWEKLFANASRTVECTKYENHNGSIPAEYDAAVIKDGNRVRVYPDLTNVGAFTAQGATNPANGQIFQPPHSWVMKCKFTPVTTTTTTSTTSTTTTTTTQPEGTTTTTTEPEVTTTTRPGEETTTTTTEPGATTTTTAPGATTTTAAPGVTTTTAAPEVTTTTADVASNPPVVLPPAAPPAAPPAPPAAPPAAPAPVQLPSTGTSPWVIALMALTALAGGTGLIRLSRRPTG